ncbi:MAG: hypothetical protein J6L91_05360, partial [Clostridia bacterium]|nr:hypothetical protein [Clostridia bacterium]
AKEASRSLASFDEINQLSDNSSDSASSSTAIEPSFDSNISELDGNMAKIAAYGSILVGTALLIFGICTVNIPAILTGIGLIAAGIAVGKNTGAFDGLTEFLSKVIEKIKGFIGNVKQKLTEIKEWISTNIIKPIVDFFTPIVEVISSILSSIFSKVWEVFMKIVEIFVALGKAFYTYVITPVVNFIKQYVAEPLKKAGTWIYNNVIKPIWDNLVWIKDKAVALFKTIGKAVVTFISNTFKTVINGILSGIESKINNFINMLNGAIYLINKIPGVQISPLTPLSIPRLASGTVVPANYGEFQAILGDNKREVEVVSPLSTMKQAFIEAMEESGNKGGAPMIIYLMMNNKVVGQAAIEYHNGVVAQTGVTPLKGV